MDGAGSMARESPDFPEVCKHLLEIMQSEGISLANQGPRISIGVQTSNVRG